MVIKRILFLLLILLFVGCQTFSKSDYFIPDWKFYINKQGLNKSHIKGIIEVEQKYTNDVNDNFQVLDIILFKDNEMICIYYGDPISTNYGTPHEKSEYCGYKKNLGYDKTKLIPLVFKTVFDESKIKNIKDYPNQKVTYYFQGIPVFDMLMNSGMRKGNYHTLIKDYAIKDLMKYINEDR